jgi:hypothetical protein
MESQSGELIKMTRGGRRGFVFPARYCDDSLFFCIYFMYDRPIPLCHRNTCALKQIIVILRK